MNKVKTLLITILIVILGFVVIGIIWGLPLISKQVSSFLKFYHTGHQARGHTYPK